MGYVLKLYPVDGDFIPDVAQEEALVDLLNQLMADCGDIDRIVYERAIAIDAGEESPVEAGPARFVVEINDPGELQEFSDEELQQIAVALGCECTQLLAYYPE